MKNYLSVNGEFVRRFLAVTILSVMTLMVCFGIVDEFLSKFLILDICIIIAGLWLENKKDHQR